MSIFESNKKEKSILDCFTYDLTTFFYDDYEEIDSEETPATVMIVYQKDLPWKELGIFDAVQFRIFFDKEKITGSNPINVKFICKTQQGSKKNLQSVFNKIVSIYGKDDFRNDKWDELDDEAYLSKSFRRVWTIDKGESFISVEYFNTKDITLNILFFNNLLKANDKQIELKV